MAALQSALRHVLGLVLLLGLGLAADGLFAGPAAGQQGCGLQICAGHTGAYSCEFSFNQWYCDTSVGGCITMECGDGGPCEFGECQT